MNIREAILRAADSIERYPHLFKFSSVKFWHDDCGSPMCALGWIGRHLRCGEYTEHRNIIDHDGLSHFNVPPRLGVGHDKFYERLDGLDQRWRDNAIACAKALRLYADKYHPAETKPIAHTGIPASVRQIFRVTA